MSTARNIIIGCKYLYEMFLVEVKKCESVSEEIIRKCHHSIVDKVINARAGLVFVLFCENYRALSRALFKDDKYRIQKNVTSTFKAEKT